MKRIFYWLGIQDALARGLISRIIIILSMVLTTFGFVFLSIRIFVNFLGGFQLSGWTNFLVEAIIFLSGLIAFWLIRSSRLRAACWVMAGGLLASIPIQIFVISTPTINITLSIGMLLFAIFTTLIIGNKGLWATTGLTVLAFMSIKTISSIEYTIPVTGQEPLGSSQISMLIWLTVSSILSILLIIAMGPKQKET